LPSSVRSYLIAEAWRLVEEEAGEPLRDPDVESRAMRAGPGLAKRVLARASELAGRHGVDAAVDAAMRRFRLAAAALAAIGLLVGFGVTRAIPAGLPAQVNVIALLALVLLPNALALLLWLAGAAWRLAGAQSGRLAAWLGQRAIGLAGLLERFATTDRYTRPAQQAWQGFLTGTPAGIQRLLLASHAFWLAVLAGAMLGLWWLMVIRQLDFVWGSTLLSAEQIRGLLSGLTQWVGAFGFEVPGAADIAASRVGEASESDDLRRRWGLFLLGAVLSLGVLPRFAAAACDAVLAALFTRQLTPDLRRTGYARLQRVLQPVTHHHEVIDPDESEPRRKAGHGAPVTDAPLPEQAAWLALERPPPLAIPAMGSGVDLGVVSTRDEQADLLAKLGDAGGDWEAVCVVVDMASTPDGGLRRLLGAILARARQPVHILLCESPAFAALPAADAETRWQDWLEAAFAAGAAADAVHRIAQR